MRAAEEQYYGYLLQKKGGVGMGPATSRPVVNEGPEEAKRALTNIFMCVGLRSSESL